MKLTPAMQQYMDAKTKYPDCILLFRMGDFYECFYEDAIAVSKILNITLTSRGKGESKAPLAGMPYHSLDKYLGKLVGAGNKIAICEQIEDPKEAKGVVKREVVRIITPGTAVEDSILSGESNNFIASLFGEDGYGLSFIDLSTGSFYFTEVNTLQEVFHELSRKKTVELIISNPTEKIKSFCTSQNIFLNPIEEKNYWMPSAIQSLRNHFDKDPMEFGFEDKDFALCASGALISHLHDTQKQGLSYIKKPAFYTTSEYMSLDSSTIKNLELLKNIHDASPRGSLLSVLDKTTNSMGKRLIKFWLTHPLKDIDSINQRLGAVNDLNSNIILNDDIREITKSLFDIERLVSKISYKLTSPKDLVNLKDTLLQLPNVSELLKETTSTKLSKLSKFKDMSELINLIDKTISEDNEGEEIVRSGAGYTSGGSGRRGIGLIKKGYNEELDELYDLKLNTKLKIKQLEDSEKEKTGMTLKVGYNKVFGYYIEVSNKFRNSVPDHYIRKQTLVNADRFITEELKEFENKLIHAESKIVTIEDEIVSMVVKEVVKNTSNLQDISSQIAEIDCLTSFAKVSYENNYTQPELTNGYEVKLKECRHPVIEQLESNFIPNDCNLFDEEFLMLITGPNMAGKSTYMRQIALNILMAQIGSFVPATYAKIGLVDQIFSRVGAYDDLSTGQSTFMVEMNETANILNNATDKSFIILDEIGRGTSTFDGVSIAWSVAEYILKNIKAKTLFATHYHVLTKLEEHQHKGIVNYHVSVSENEDEIIFLRKIVRGGTDKSFGVQVAKLAGLPKEVIENAKKVQHKLETEDEMLQRIDFEKKSNGEETEVKVEQKDLTKF